MNINQNVNKKSFLECYDFTKIPRHYFEELSSSFWDSENMLTKIYKNKKQNLPKNPSEKDEKQNNGISEENLLKNAYSTLLNTKSKSRYFDYLFYEYTSSQPLTLPQLIEKFYSIIFPYYIFLIKNYSYEETNYLKIDYINFTISIFAKNCLKNSFEVNEISEIEIKNDHLEISLNNDRENLNLYPLIIQQIEIIYVTIMFMLIIKRKIENRKKELSKVNEINQNLEKIIIKTIDEKKLLNSKFEFNKLKILTNDSFVPKGIKISCLVSTTGYKNIPDKYILIGLSYIFIFKTELMNELIDIIPLSSGFTIFEFNEEENNIKIRAGIKDFNFFFEQKKNFLKSQEILCEIMEGNSGEILDDDILKCSKRLYDDKIMGGVFENTPIYEKSKKQIELLKKKLDDLNLIKDKLTNEYKIDKIIFNKIDELDTEI